MKSLLKWIAISAAGLVLLIAIGIALLLFVVDPNNYKPEIESLAAEQNIDLKINGDLGWKFFPSIAITVGETEVSGEGLPDISVQQTELALGLRELINGNIAVQTISLQRPHIRLELTDSNAGEQAAAIAAAPVAAGGASQQNNGDRAIALNIERLSIVDGTIELLSEGTVQRRIEQLNIDGQQINLNDKAFPLSLALRTQLEELGTTVQLNLSGQFKTDSAFQQISLTDTELELMTEGGDFDGQNLNVSFQANADLQADTLQLSGFKASLGKLVINLNAQIEQLTGTPAINGKLDIPAFDPHNLPPVVSDALAEVPVKSVALSGDIKSSGVHHSVNNLKLAMDDFTMTGNLDAVIATTNTINATLSGTRLNLDRYLPKSEQSSGEQTNNQTEALLAPLLAPLAALNGGKGVVDIKLQQLLADGMQLDEIQINATGNGKVLKLNKLAAKGFGGSVNAAATADMSGNTPALNFNVAATAIDIGASLIQLADYNEVKGHGDLQFGGTTRGNTEEELLANLNGSGNFKLANPEYTAMNIEQQFCSVAGDRDKGPANWQQGSRFDNADGSFTVKGQQLTFQNLTTGVGNLKLRGKGGLALIDQTMDMTMTFNIAGAKSSEEGCVLRSKSIQNRDIPLRLRGNIADMNSMVSNALVDLIARMVIEDKTDDLLNKLLGGKKEETEEPKEGEKPSTKDLLRDLLKKR
ncbi:AsmA family protein [Porticoccaceae bacterium LTM1]|nr:AsmA family protein [Porticoccaceae bacterium LTM1]